MRTTKQLTAALIACTAFSFLAAASPLQSCSKPADDANRLVLQANTEPQATVDILRQELSEAVQSASGVFPLPDRILVSLQTKSTGLGPEGYRITSDGESSEVQVNCTGEDRRGLIYAVFDLAQRIRFGEPITHLAVQEVPYSTYRQIVACSNDHDFYRRLVSKMPGWRMNALLLYSAYHSPDRVGPDSGKWFGTYLTLPITYRKYPKIRAMIEESPDFQHVRESFPALLREAALYGVDISLKFQILSYVRVDKSGGHYMESARNFPEDFPALFPDGKRPDWNSAAVYDFIREQLEELFDLYPGLSGITATSDEMSPFNIGHVASSGTLEERKTWTRRMVETVEEVCARYNKRCYWDLHGSGESFVNNLIEISKSRPGRLRLRAESTRYEQVFSDKFPSYPFDKVAAAGDGMCDHDVHMESFQDFPWLPNIVDHFVVRHTMDGIAAGLRGGGAMWYIYRPQYSPVNSLAQINMELLSRLLWNPKEPVDRIWDRWLSRRFGARGAPVASRLLRSTQDVLNATLYFDNRNATFWFQYGFPKNLHWLMRPTWGQLIEYFQKPGTPLYAHPFSAASQERALSMDQMRAEKRAAVKKASELMEDLQQHRNELQGCDYRTLLPRYLALWYFARAAEQLVEALYNFSNLHIKAYDTACTEPRKGMEQAIERLQKIHEEMSRDERLHWLETDVYDRGLRPMFLDAIPTCVTDLRFHDRVLSAGPSILQELQPTEQQDARTILDYAEKIREKFERNVLEPRPAEEYWARTVGER